jgi:hypothetical protein
MARCLKIVGAGAEEQGLPVAQGRRVAAPSREGPSLLAVVRNSQDDAAGKRKGRASLRGSFLQRVKSHRSTAAPSSSNFAAPAQGGRWRAQTSAGVAPSAQPPPKTMGLAPQNLQLWGSEEGPELGSSGEYSRAGVIRIFALVEAELTEMNESEVRHVREQGRRMKDVMRRRGDAMALARKDEMAGIFALAEAELMQIRTGGTLQQRLIRDITRRAKDRIAALEYSVRSPKHRKR